MYKAGANCVYLNKWYVNLIKKNCTGKSVSEALILESVDPKYGDRLIVQENSEHVKNMLCTKIVLNVKTKTEHVKNMLCMCTKKSFLFWHSKQFL